MICFGYESGEQSHLVDFHCTSWVIVTCKQFFSFKIGVVLVEISAYSVKKWVRKIVYPMIYGLIIKNHWSAERNSKIEQNSVILVQVFHNIRSVPWSKLLLSSYPPETIFKLQYIQGDLNKTTSILLCVQKSKFKKVN